MVIMDLEKELERLERIENGEDPKVIDAENKFKQEVKKTKGEIFYDKITNLYDKFKHSKIISTLNKKFFESNFGKKIKRKRRIKNHSNIVQMYEDNFGQSIKIGDDIGSYNVKNEDETLKYFVNNIILNKPRYRIDGNGKILKVTLKDGYTFKFINYHRIFALKVFKPLKEDFEKKAIQHKISYSAAAAFTAIALALGFKSVDSNAKTNKEAILNEAQDDIDLSEQNNTPSENNVIYDEDILKEVDDILASDTNNSETNKVVDIQKNIEVLTGINKDSDVTGKTMSIELIKKINEVMEAEEVNTVTETKKIETPEVETPEPVEEVTPQENEVVVNNEVTPVPMSNTNTVDLDFEDLTYTDRIQFVHDAYGDVIQKYANKYGLDYNMICAMAAQERGVHSEVKDPGGAVGLMQIQVSANPDGATLDTITYDKGYPEINEFTFYRDNYKTLEGNIEAGCAVLSYMLHFNACENTIAAMYGYNFGWNGPEKGVRAYANDLGVSEEDVLRNVSDTTWRSYFLPSNPKRDYVQMVLRFCRSNTITNLDANGNPVTTYINNSQSLSR